MTERLQALPWLLWVACLALLPFGRSAELPMLAAALLGLVAAIRNAEFRRDPTTRLAGILFLGYWLPELVSALDAQAAAKAWGEVASDLRYLPMLAWFGFRLRQPGQWPRACGGIAVIVLLWASDALLQATTGWSLGGPVSSDRLSGIFGAEDLKLGAVLAVLSPFLLIAARERGRHWPGAAVVLLGLVILLAGTRAAWLMYALVCMGLLLRGMHWKQTFPRLLLAVAVALAMAIPAYRLYPPLSERIDRTAAVLQGDRSGLDFALASRLPIWETAGRMIAAHPINGVGVRGFRNAYAEFATANDPWLDFNGPGLGAAHPHQWLLEVLVDCGVVGLLIWLTVILRAYRAHRKAATRQRGAALPASLAILALLFPLNTHYAVYSSAWGGLLLVLAAGWLAAISAQPSSVTGPADDQ